MPASELEPVSKHKNTRMIVASTIASFCGVLLLSSYFIYRRQRNKAEINYLENKSEKDDIDLTTFDFSFISNATNHFSESNKLGQGDFGLVYKGILPEGQEIAVKRLSETSGQGLDEFTNEVYSTRCTLLGWAKRFEIIGGIARGLLYLHQDSKLKIIHRDPKTVKSDVYSFGAIVLEIITGSKIKGFYDPRQRLNLLGHAWRLWIQKSPMEFMDDLVDNLADLSEILRHIHVGMLCVQQRPEDRPNMSFVVLMLKDEMLLPEPSQPGFYTGNIVHQ